MKNVDGKSFAFQNNDTLELIREWIESDIKLVFGYNTYTAALVKVFNIKAIIDDFNENISIDNIPIVRTSEIVSNYSSSVVLIASGGNTISISKKLEDFGIRNFSYYQLYSHFKIKYELRDIFLNENFEKIYYQNQSRFEQVYRSLDDEMSKSNYSNLVGFRLTYNHNYLLNFFENQVNQYFDGIIGNPSSGTFLDIGAFDGFTTKKYIELFPNYKRIEIFEPDLSNLEKCKQNLSSYSNIKYNAFGLSNKNEQVSFTYSGSTSKADSEGEAVIVLRTLDSLNLNNVSFLKVDIEGDEINFLKGAKETLKRTKPNMAISIYHSPEDFYRLHEFVVTEIFSGYKVYVRNYTETIYESIMYFIYDKS